MPKPKLSVTCRDVNTKIDRLSVFLSEIDHLDIAHQYFISEMIMLRQFSILESALADIAYKLASGSTYLDGSLPTLLITARSMQGARQLFLSHDRPKQKQNLQWTKASYISNSVNKVIDVSDKYIQTVRNNGERLNEMRIVRNTLAHNSNSARVEYKKLIRLKYGARVNLRTGAFLISLRRNNPSNLVNYLRFTKFLVNHICR